LVISRKVLTSQTLQSFTMISPRIYTYKVTFEEVPYWYWGVHKEKKFGETYLGTPITHKWMWEFYTPKIQILEFFPNTEEGWKEANLVEDRLIKPDLNHPLCLNEACGGKLSLAGLSQAGQSGGSKTFELKTGRYNAEDPRNIEGWKKGGSRGGMTLLRTGKGIHDKTDPRNKEGSRIGGEKMSAVLNSQKWQCLVTGYISTPGPLTRYQKARGIDPKNRVQLS